MLRRLVLAIVFAGLIAPTIPNEPALADEPYAPQSAATARLQRALKDKGLYRGPIDGSFGAKTQQAVMAFRKEIGVRRSFSWSNSLWDELEIYQAPYTRFDEPDRVEVNLTKQTAHLFREGNLVATFPISTGNGELFTNSFGNLSKAVTPTGNYKVYRRAKGWYTSYLGQMLSPWFFNGGIALHGSTSVPPGPASHGCVRLTTWDSDFINKHMFIGMPVHVYRSSEGPVWGSDGPFADVPADHPFVNAISWMVDNGYTNGCRDYFYCPRQPTTRGEIAVFMKRSLASHLGTGPPASFTDTDGHVFESAISWMAGLGITQGCNPPDNDRFCPERRVTRGEMSALFKRALEHLIVVDPASVDPGRFTDTQSSVFVNSTAWLAASGITVGCNPPDNTRFCPDAPVTRGELAVFLKRILDRL
jgi:hypothetical protein